MNLIKQNNHYLTALKAEFLRTCSLAEIKETEKYFYKICPFGEMRLWKKSNRISICKKG